MKDNNYYVVYGWMVNKLKLKGTALQLYAVIYGFSQDGDSECSGSLAFLAETTGCTKQTILNGLDKLERLGYIQKRQTRDSDGGLRNHYRVNFYVEDEKAEDYLGETWDTDVVVIGNIYDNPELLKGE